MSDLKHVLTRLAETARLMIGIPDYDRYRQHRLQHHPDAPVMSYQEFFRERQNTRYGAADGKINRCC